MTFDDLQQQWQESNASAAHPPIDADFMLRTVRRVEKSNREILRRDWIETAAALLVICLFGKNILDLDGWMAKTGSFICICGAVFTIYKLHSTRWVWGTSRLDLPVREYYDLETQRVEKQIHLLQTIATWYLAPFFIGVNLGFAGLSPSLLWTFAYFLLVLLIYWGIYLLNQRAVTKHFVPLYEELKAVQKELNEPNSNHTLSQP